MRKKTYAHAAVKPAKLQLPRKVALSGLSVVLVSALMCPGLAFAAERLWINDAEQVVGNSGEGWEWVDADNLNLDGYNGGQIYAKGDLTINVAGENTVTAEGSAGHWSSPDGIALVNGDLTIQGEGAIDINAGYDGIYVDEGGLTVDGTTLNITTDGSDGGWADGIYTYGNIEINDATINIDASANENAHGIYSDGTHGIYSDGTWMEQGGHIAINNSDVSIKVSGPEDNPSSGFGIYAITSGNNSPASIAIDGSNVDIQATNAAMMAKHEILIDEAAENPIDPSTAPGGIISITNCNITSPEGARVVDFAVEEGSWEDGGDIAEMNFEPRTYRLYKGQTIATVEGTITSFDDPNIATSVTIETEAQDKAPAGLPQMGDASMLLAVIAFAACAAAATGLVLVRKRQ